MKQDMHERLFNDYFANKPVYPNNVFRQRFQIRKALFLRIIETLTSHSKYFQLKVNAIGKQEVSPLQKCTATI